MRVLNWVSRLSDLGMIVSMVTLVIIMVLVTVDVILRNLFSNSITGTVEISELLQGVVVFLGMAATLKSGHHIAADFLVERLSIRSQAMIDLVTGLISLSVMSVMAFALWQAATGPGAAHEVTSLLEIPTQPFWMVAALGVALMCMELLRLIVACVAVLREQSA